MDVRGEMMANRDLRYSEFSAKLVESGLPILGVRLPVLRDMAKRISKEDWRGYLDGWNGEYMEDVMLRGFVISYARMDLQERLGLFNDHIELIDNWSTCDSFCTTWKPKKDDRDEVWHFILPYLETGEEFPMRYAVVMMLTHFIDGKHIDDVLYLLDSHRHDGYYYRMAVAWNISVCFVKFPERTMDYLKDNNLDDWTYNKALQKILESYRVSDEMKTIIKGMKRIRSR